MGRPLGRLRAWQGFRYRVLAAEGDEMDDGGIRPAVPDGMEVYDAGGGRLALCANHEIRPDRDQENSALMRPGDRPMSIGGCTTLILAPDLSREVLFVSQSDSIFNCAGGRTPWGTWLTCEEFETPGESAAGPDRGYGFVYDVDPLTGENGPHYPAMGRFRP